MITYSPTTYWGELQLDEATTLDAAKRTLFAQFADYAIQNNLATFTEDAGTLRMEIQVCAPSTNN